MFRPLEMFFFRILRFFFPKAATVIRAIYAHQTTVPNKSDSDPTLNSALNVTDLVSYHDVFNLSNINKKCIAVISPMPPAQTGIAD